jgi:DNA-binding GntR family transcriptional regulator
MKLYMRLCTTLDKGDYQIIMNINRREEAYQKIRDAIAYGKLKPGERLVEERICDMLKVGRTPLREAIRQLQMEGCVDVLPNKGAVISKISIQDVENIYDIVATLEGYAVKIATSHIGPTEKKKLKSIHNDLKQAGLAKNYGEWVEKNAAFHGYFPKVSGNFYLPNVINSLRDRVYRYRIIAISIPRHIEEYICAHEEILEAVFKERGKQAGDAMQKHVLSVKKILIDFLEQSPGL